MNKKTSVILLLICITLSTKNLFSYRPYRWGFRRGPVVRRPVAVGLTAGAVIASSNNHYYQDPYDAVYRAEADQEIREIKAQEQDDREARKAEKRRKREEEKARKNKKESNKEHDDYDSQSDFNKNSELQDRIESLKMRLAEIENYLS